MLLNDFNVVELKRIFLILCDYWELQPIKFYKYDKAGLVQLIRDTQLIIEKKEYILVKFKSKEIKSMKPTRQNFRLKYGKYYNNEKIQIHNKQITINFD
jgi:hypothetical protein